MTAHPDGETITVVILPRWLRRRVPVDQWLNEVRGAQALRPETVRFAATLAGSGFRADGQQYRPRALSLLSQDAGISVASVKRHLRILRQRQFLTMPHRMVLSAGKRGTPLHALTLPVTAPASVGPWLDAMAKQFPADDFGPRPAWGARLTAPPSWATK